MMIPHSKPTLDKNDVRNISKVIRSGQIACNGIVREFETRLADFIGTKDAVATSSGTSALHLALCALDIGPGDEVIVPSYVCSAPLNAVHYTGATPVLCDINLVDFNLEVDNVKKKISSRTKAIIVPHMFGTPADMDKLLKLGIPIIEDCAHSIGASYKGKKTGSFGLLSIFSFYATKMMTTGEGGMVSGNSRKLLEKIRDLREYDRKQNYRIRYNYKMTEIQAALGISQLTRLPSFIARRKEIVREFSIHFAGIKYLKLPPTDTDIKDVVFYRYVIRIEKTCALSAIINFLKKKGVMAERPVYKPLHKYIKSPILPNTQKAYNSCISLPIYPLLTQTEIRHIINTVKKIPPQFFLPSPTSGKTLR